MAIFDHFLHFCTFYRPKKLSFDGGILWPHGFLDFRNLEESKKPCGHPQISSKDHFLGPPECTCTEKWPFLTIFRNFALSTGQTLVVEKAACRRNNALGWRGG
ncbi:MAG: hypothetical protein GY755_08130 [Chloroflexi bacterium]|nr:hypothetical protein [Chloroflexota bacterium]